MKWIYLSPHLDDAVLSCGGLIWEQAQSGFCPSVWTVCAGDAPPGPLSPFAQLLHERWEAGPSAWEHRREEDQASCQILGAAPLHLPVSDCIYRRDPASGEALYASNEALFGPLQPADENLVLELADEFRLRLAQEAGEVQVVCPLGIGEHVDHRLTRRAAEAAGLPLMFYADYPYVTLFPGLLEEALSRTKLEPVVFPLSEAALEAWVQSIEAHGSQISTFWDNVPAMRADIKEYSSQMGGMRLWQRSRD